MAARAQVWLDLDRAMRGRDLGRLQAAIRKGVACIVTSVQDPAGLPAGISTACPPSLSPMGPTDPPARPTLQPSRGALRAHAPVRAQGPIWRGAVVADACVCTLPSRSRWELVAESDLQP